MKLSLREDGAETFAKSAALLLARADDVIGTPAMARARPSCLHFGTSSAGRSPSTWWARPAASSGSELDLPAIRGHRRAMSDDEKAISGVGAVSDAIAVVADLANVPVVGTLVARAAGRLEVARRKRMEERIARFLEGIEEEFRFGTEEEAARRLEEMPLEVQESLFDHLRSVLNAPSSAVAPIAARLFILQRTEANLSPRRVRRALRLLAEADANAVTGIRAFVQRALSEWPPHAAESAATLTLRGNEVILEPLSPNAGHTTFPIEDPEAVFDLLAQHFFRYEGPAPGTAHYTLGGSSDGVPVITCTRQHLEFLSRILGDK
ncbi:MAG: hypothetical protein HYY06_14900 [Deltaproteobacteria bacterium]|nr:hypothetical protein [Deltaproteobacteria bacterium]